MYKPSVRVPAPKIGGGPASSSAFKVSSSPPLICLLALVPLVALTLYLFFLPYLDIIFVILLLSTVALRLFQWLHFCCWTFVTAAICYLLQVSALPSYKYHAPHFNIFRYTFHILEILVIVIQVTVPILLFIHVPKLFLKLLHKNFTVN